MRNETPEPRMTASEELALLRGMEWVGLIPLYTGSSCYPDYILGCMWCRNRKKSGVHQTDCPMDRLIRQTEADVSEEERLRAALRAINRVNRDSWDEQAEDMQRIAREALEAKP